MEKLSEWSNEFEYLIKEDDGGYRLYVIMSKKADKTLNIICEEFVSKDDWIAAGADQGFKKAMMFCNAIYRKLYRKIVDQ